MEVGLRELVDWVYVGRDFFKDVLVYLGGGGVFIHCVGDCVKGTGCVVYEVKGLVSGEYVEVGGLELRPPLRHQQGPHCPALALGGVEEAGEKRLEEAFNLIR